MTNRREVMIAATALLARPLRAGQSEQPTRLFELRQYTLHPNRRDDLIALFESQFIQPQEALGAQVLGTFRDSDDPERFVWLRGFADMETRAEALGAFYGGPIWAANRNAANSTILDSDNVLLLRPYAQSRSAFEQTTSSVSPRYGISLHYLGDVDPVIFASFFDRFVTPELARRGQSIVTFVTEKSANNFPRLPVRENESVFGWLGRWKNDVEMVETWRAIANLAGWREHADAPTLQALMRKPERLRLEPTVRSRMR